MSPVAQQVSNVVSGFYADIRGAGNTLYASTGALVDSSTLSLRANLGTPGRPCVDAPANRVYLVNGGLLLANDATTGSFVGSFGIPTTATGDWALGLVRWGLDGFAILGPDRLYHRPVSTLVPAGLDANGNGIDDAWETTYFGALGVTLGADSDGDGVRDALEYLFVTVPTQAGPNPVRTSVTRDGLGRSVLHLTFPRRAGLPTGSYGYESSADLTQWVPVAGVIETITGTQVIGGVTVETVDAALPATTDAHGFTPAEMVAPVRKSSFRAPALAAAVVTAGLAAGGWWISRPALPPAPAPPAALRDPPRPPGPPDKPNVELTTDRQLDRVQHKDAEGRSPLERIETPEGTVTVRRTLNADGKIVREEAFLNGRPVPVPRR